MITLGFVTAVCMVLMAVLVLQRVNSLLAFSVDAAEGDGPPGPDPMDLPGDGLSPFDLFLQSLPVAPVDDRVGLAVAAL
jgi:hypothetical protein